MYKFYVTYGNGTNLKNRFSVVVAENYGKAREVIHEVTSGRFAFCYSEEEFKGQIEKYGLIEVPLQAQVFL